MAFYIGQIQSNHIFHSLMEKYKTPAIAEKGLYFDTRQQKRTDEDKI